MKNEFKATGEDQFKAFPFELKASSSDGSRFEGIASAFFNIDRGNEIVDDGAFNKSLPEFIKSGFLGGVNHNWDLPCGKPKEGTKVVADGLWLDGQVSDTVHGKDVKILIKDGVITKLSIGYRVLDAEFLENPEDIKAYWDSKKYDPSDEDLARSKRGALLLKEVELFEVSPVTMPMNKLARIARVKAMEAMATIEAEMPDVSHEEEPESVREYEKFLREAGLSKADALRAVSLGKKLFAIKLLRDAVSDVPIVEVEAKTEEATAEIASEILAVADVEAGEIPVETKVVEAGADSVETADITLATVAAPQVEPEVKTEEPLNPLEEAIRVEKAKAIRASQLRMLALDAKLAAIQAQAAGA